MDEIFFIAEREKHLRLGRMIASRSLRAYQVLWYAAKTVGREIQGYYFKWYERFLIFYFRRKFIVCYEKCKRARSMNRILYKIRVPSKVRMQMTVSNELFLILFYNRRFWKMKREGNGRIFIPLMFLVHRTQKGAAAMSLIAICCIR